MKSLRERLFSRLVIDPVSGCLLWTGKLDRDGYGQVYAGGKGRRVHRVVYELFEGSLPDDLHIDHLCRVRNCANPTHMEPVTNRVNVLRGESFMAVYARRTHCDNGHEFTEANTHLRKDGGRLCRQCHRDRQRRYKQEKHAA